MPSEKKALTLPLRLALGLLFAGALFKIMHWPGANYLLLAAYAAIAVLYPIRYYKKSTKMLIDHVKLALVLSWAFSGAFQMFYWPGAAVFSVVFAVSFIAWVVLQLQTTEEVAPGTKVTGFVIHGLFALAAILITVGAFFKIMHWPYANVMLIVGFVIALGWVLKTGIFSEK